MNYTRDMKKKFHLRLLVALLIPIQSAAALAADNPFAIFEEEARVVTASRRSESISEAPVAIDVITAEEIRASGAVHLWDLLRYRVGMNVIDGRTSGDNRAIVAIRGFAERFTRNVLVLVDGRKVISPLDGGTDWDQLPVQIQDIARIEIIRGPNAALYGSGAGLGVINIITAKPAGDESAAVDARGGNRGTLQSAESVDSSVKGLSYRLSHEFRQEGNRSDQTGASANDFLHSHKANFRGRWNAGKDTEIEAFAGGSWTNAGVPAAQNPQNRYDQHYEAARVIRAHGEGASTEFFSSRSEATKTLVPGAVAGADRDVVVQYDEQLLHRRDWGDGRLKSTFGADYQAVRADSPGQSAGYSTEKTGRAYFNQTARIVPSVLWIGAVSFESRKSGKPDVNYQFSQLWQFAAAHSFRLSYSVAHTVPTLRLLRADTRIAGAPLTGNPGLRPQTLTSYESGYRGSWLDRRLAIEANLYYTVVKDIDDIVPAAAPGANTFGNVNSAIARGAELQLRYQFTPRRWLYANYTHERLTDAQGNTGEITRNTPAHALNLGAAGDLGRGFSGSFNAGYKDHYSIANQGEENPIRPYWRLDVRMVYVFPRYKNAEFYVAGQNLLQRGHLEFADGLVVPRTVSGGVTLKFGGTL